MVIAVIALWWFVSAAEVAKDDCRPVGLTGFQSQFCGAGDSRKIQPWWVLEP